MNKQQNDITKGIVKRIGVTILCCLPALIIIGYWLRGLNLFYSLLPENRRKKSRRETGVLPIVQALAPFSLGGCRAVIELVSHASLIGLLFDSV